MGARGKDRKLNYVTSILSTPYGPLSEVPPSSNKPNCASQILKSDMSIISAWQLERLVPAAGRGPPLHNPS